MDLTELLEIAERERTAQKPVQIRCCVAAGCLSADSLAVKQGLEAAVTETGLEDRVAGLWCWLYALVLPRAARTSCGGYAL